MINGEAYRLTGRGLIRPTAHHMYTQEAMSDKGALGFRQEICGLSRK